MPKISENNSNIFSQLQLINQNFGKYLAKILEKFFLEESKFLKILSKRVKILKNIQKCQNMHQICADSLAQICADTFERSIPMS